MEHNTYTPIDTTNNVMVSDYDSKVKKGDFHNINELYLFRAVRNPLQVTNGEEPR